MAEMINVCIGIQARSTSTRFPRKVLELIDGKPILRHVIDSANKAARFINRHTPKTGILVTVYVVIPEGDEIKRHFGHQVSLLEGPEQDVLTRYWKLAETTGADFIVRITADCPLIPQSYISKHVNCAVLNKYDYLSNVDEEIRLTPDGMDCEVISKRLLEYTFQTATDPTDREHVTLLMRKDPPAWAKVGHIIGFLDLAHLKLSVDTKEDLERVRSEYQKLKNAVTKAEIKHGRDHVHRF